MKKSTKAIFCLLKSNASAVIAYSRNTFSAMLPKLTTMLNRNRNRLNIMFSKKD